LVARRNTLDVMRRYTSPGVYVEGVALGARAVSHVPSTTTAFVGRTRRGPVERPGLVGSFAEFEAIFGGLWAEAPLTHAVQHYFLNGGREAVVCRIRNGRERIEDAHLSDPGRQADRRGLWALDRVEDLDIVVIPPLGPDRDVGRVTWDAAATFARRRRAMLIVDAPAAWQAAGDITPAALDALISPGEARANAALYFPRIVAPDPTAGGSPTTFAPGGAVAGIYARTQATRGLLKSPAGVEAGIVGVAGLALNLTDSGSDLLNPRGINVLRTFPSTGPVVWGGRTLVGDDVLASDWKYVAVRRTALYIERAIERGTRWVVFEPNDEPVWAELRLHVGSFLRELFRAGAFQGRTDREAYFARCDASTTTQADIDNRRVILEVGFAPIRPAEFVVLRFDLAAGPGPR
jgi:hypothetical protein